VLRPQQPFTGLQAALVVGLRLLVVALVLEQSGQIADGDECGWVLRPQQPFTGLQIPSVVGLRLLVIALVLEQAGQIANGGEWGSPETVDRSVGPAT